MSLTVAQKTNHSGFPKPGELIEITGAHGLEAADRAILNRLYQLAHEAGNIAETEAEWSWRVDETYIKIKGAWTYLYRAVDSLGRTIDFRLSPRRDTAAAKRFFRKALNQPHVVNPRTITVDKNPAYPRAVRQLKRGGELWRFSRLRQRKYLNNIVEQDHRRMKRLVRPGLGFGSLRTARRTLAGYEAMAMIRKGQVYNVGGRDMKAQAALVAGLFGVAA